MRAREKEKEREITRQHRWRHIEGKRGKDDVNEDDESVEVDDEDKINIVIIMKTLSQLPKRAFSID